MITLQNSSLEKFIQSMPVNTLKITKRGGGYIFISNVFNMHLYAINSSKLSCSLTRLHTLVDIS